MAKKKSKKSQVKKVTKIAKKHPKGFLIAVLVLVLIAALAVGGYFVYVNFLAPKETSFVLNGGNVESVALNATYEEKGAKAIYKGKDISNEISIKYYEGSGETRSEVSAITTNVEKTFTVDYSIVHEDLNKTLQRTVNVTSVAAMSINFLELGNYNTGDCTYIKAGDVDILIDAGSKKNSSDTVVNYLKQEGHVNDGKIEYLIVTHAHEDHIAALVGKSDMKGVFDSFDFGTIIQFSKTNSTTVLYNDFCTKRDEAVSKGAVLKYAHEVTEETYNIAPGITMNVLDQRFYHEVSSDENNHSVCTLFTQGDNHYLFTGDLEKEGEESLVSLNTLPRCQLFKGGHHGSKTSNNDCLLSVIQPEIVCICCCAGNDEYTSNVDNQFPTQDAINRIAIYTKKIYVTTMSTDGHHGYASMNGIISFTCLAGAAYEVHGSNNDTILKETDWFKANRTWPSGGVV